jgi:DNA-binding LytR/AlgR family response regulator
MELKCLVADDEELAVEIVTAYLQQHTDLQLAATCYNGKEVLHAMAEHKPNILFLDINMPYVTGLEIAKQFSHQYAIVFTTAYAQHAVESFDLNAVDYLLKPFSAERFAQAVQKAKQFLRFDTNESTDEELEPYLIIKANLLQQKLIIKNILYIQGKKQYVKIVTDGNSYMVLESLKYYEEVLTKQRFLRLHKSFIVNPHYITTLGTKTVGVKGFEIPIGDKYRPALDKLKTLFN